MYHLRLSNNQSLLYISVLSPRCNKNLKINSIPLCNTLFQYNICTLLNKQKLTWYLMTYSSCSFAIQVVWKVYLLYICFIVILNSLSILQYILMCSMCVCDMVLDICFPIFKQWNIKRKSIDDFSGLTYWTLNNK